MKQWQRHLDPARRRKKEGTGKHLNKTPPLIIKHYEIHFIDKIAGISNKNFHINNPEIK